MYYLKDFINNFKNSDTGKIQLTIANIFYFFYNDEDRVMHSKSDNIEFMINNEANELELRRGSEFVFDYVHLLYHKFHKINPNRSGSYIDSPDWIKNKKATINQKENKSFQKIEKNNVTIPLNVLYAKKEKIYPPKFQNTTQIVKNKLF